MLMSILIFGGSLGFVAVEILLSPFAPLQVFTMTLLIQARHLFYGLSMLEKIYLYWTISATTGGLIGSPGCITKKSPESLKIRGFS